MKKITTLDQVTLTPDWVKHDTERNHNQKMLACKRAELLEAVEDFMFIGGAFAPISSILDVFGDNLRLCAEIELLLENNKIKDEDLREELPRWNHLNDTFYILAETIKAIVKISNLHDNATSFEHRAALIDHLKGHPVSA